MEEEEEEPLADVPEVAAEDEPPLLTVQVEDVRKNPGALKASTAKKPLADVPEVSAARAEEDTRPMLTVQVEDVRKDPVAEPAADEKEQEPKEEGESDAAASRKDVSAKSSKTVARREPTISAAAKFGYV